MKVFVYGTLLSGERNNYLLARSNLLGNTEVSKMQMFSLGQFPACVPTDNEKDIVHGEVWEIDEKTFQKLDWLEGYPDFYNRVEVETSHGKAWMYICEEARGKSKISSGDWKAAVEESNGTLY